MPAGVWIVGVGAAGDLEVAIVTDPPACDVLGCVSGAGATGPVASVEAEGELGIAGVCRCGADGLVEFGPASEAA
jgi:hypothetical protein